MISTASRTDRCESRTVYPVVCYLTNPFEYDVRFNFRSVQVGESSSQAHCRECMHWTLRLRIRSTPERILTANVALRSNFRSVVAFRLYVFLYKQSCVAIACLRAHVSGSQPGDIITVAPAVAASAWHEGAMPLIVGDLLQNIRFLQNLFIFMNTTAKVIFMKSTSHCKLPKGKVYLFYFT